MFILTAITNVIGFVQHRLDRAESGASMVEYALLVALIAAVCIAAVTLLGGAIKNIFSGVGNTLTSVSS